MPKGRGPSVNVWGKTPPSCGWGLEGMIWGTEGPSIWQHCFRVCEEGGYGLGDRGGLHLATLFQSMRKGGVWSGGQRGPAFGNTVSEYVRKGGMVWGTEGPCIWQHCFRVREEGVCGLGDRGALHLATLFQST